MATLNAGIALPRAFDGLDFASIAWEFEPVDRGLGRARRTQLLVRTLIRTWMDDGAFRLMCQRGHPCEIDDFDMSRV